MALTLAWVKEDPVISALVNACNDCLEKLGYTEHGPRHAGYVSRMAGEILEKLGYPERMTELARIAGWVHDVGNLLNRRNHGVHGAVLLFPILREMGMDIGEVCMVTAAVGHHEEEIGFPVNEIAAAIIIADKIDAHRARVRKGKYDFNDIHDRVNYSIRKTHLIVDSDKKLIRYEFEMDPSSSVMEFLKIYFTRMEISEKAALVLGCTFEIVVNGMHINNIPQNLLIDETRREQEDGGITP